MKTKQSHIKKLNRIEIEISRLTKENEKLKVENRKLREKVKNPPSQFHYSDIKTIEQ